jgi:hypothetical protein
MKKLVYNTSPNCLGVKFSMLFSTNFWCARLMFLIICFSISKPNLRHRHMKTVVPPNKLIRSGNVIWFKIIIKIKRIYPPFPTDDKFQTADPYLEYWQGSSGQNHTRISAWSRNLNFISTCMNSGWDNIPVMNQQYRHLLWDLWKWECSLKVFFTGILFCFKKTW